MRLKMQFNLENDKFPIQYRKNILSFIKKSLSDYDVDYYNTIYHEKDNIIKPFTFSIFFYNSIFEKENIIVNNKSFCMYISFEDVNTAIVFYNAFNNQINKKIPVYGNSMRLENITMIPEKKIGDNSVNIKFLSPLVVRSRQENRDYYYSFRHEEFEEMIKINIKEQLKVADLPLELADNFNIKPINAKKTVVKFYEKQMECSLGSFNISGDARLLEYLYKAGLGSRHSSGFGMFDII